MGPDGAPNPVAEIVAQTNEIMADWTFIEGNLPTGHQSNIRTGLPVATWQTLYGWTPASKSEYAQVTDTCGIIKAYAGIDPELRKRAKDPDAFMFMEAKGHIQGIAQTLATTLFYGTGGNAFTGLAPRFSSLSAESGDNIIDAGGVGTDNASIWLIGWSPQTITGIVPRNSEAGIEVKKVDNQVERRSNGGVDEYREMDIMIFKQSAGLSVQDWRYAVRIANIDRSSLTPDASSGANLPQLMFEALERIPEARGDIRLRFYMDRDVRTKFHQQLAAGVNNSTLRSEEVGGIRSPMFQDEVPVRRADALRVDEARVT